MDIWDKLFNQAKILYKPHEVSPFIYAQHVVTALEADNGDIYTGFCFEATAGVFHLCSERAVPSICFKLVAKLKLNES